MSSTIAYRVTLSLVVPRCDIALHCKNVLIDTLKTKLQYSTYPDPKGFDKNVNNMSPHGQAECGTMHTRIRHKFLCWSGHDDDA